MINKILNEEKFYNNYESILKYLSFQKIYINSDLFKNIYSFSNQNEVKNLDNKYLTNKEDIYHIKRINNILSKLNLDYETDYLYYTLILLSLPNFMIINLFRFFISNYLLLKNYDKKNPNKLNNNKILKFLTFKKLKYNINDINKSTKPLEILIETLENLSDNNNNILFFIHCINLFFT